MNLKTFEKCFYFYKTKSFPCSFENCIFQKNWKPLRRKKIWIFRIIFRQIWNVSTRQSQNPFHRFVDAQHVQPRPMSRVRIPAKANTFDLFIFQFCFIWIIKPEIVGSYHKEPTIILLYISRVVNIGNLLVSMTLES